MMERGGFTVALPELTSQKTHLCVLAFSLHSPTEAVLHVEIVPVSLQARLQACKPQYLLPPPPTRTI